MTRYIIRRLLWGVLLLIAVSALLFLMFRYLPTADPAKLRAGRRERRQHRQSSRETLDPVRIAGGRRAGLVAIRRTWTHHTLKKTVSPRPWSTMSKRYTTLPFASSR